MPVVKPISDQTRALTTIQEREDHIQRTIAHGYDDLTNGRVRPWKQAKAEADRMRPSAQGVFVTVYPGDIDLTTALPHVTIL